MTAIATPPPSLPVLCVWIQLLYPGIFGGICFVSVILIMSAWYVSAAARMLASFPLIPLAFAYSIFNSLRWLIVLLFSFVLFSVMASLGGISLVNVVVARVGGGFVCGFV